MLAANLVLVPRVLAATAVLAPPLAMALVPRLVPAAVVLALLLPFTRHSSRDPGDAQPAAASQPLRVGPALQMALLFQLVLYAVSAAEAWFGQAGLFTTAAGLQNVTGITNPTDTYELTQTRAGDRWSFSFKDTNGKTGAIAFTLPAQLESFFVDPQEKTQGDPLLYKEWRLSAPIAVTGVFAPSGNATARLVLQGRGNSCTSADQLTSYMLIVKGPTAQFTLFGALAAPAP